MSNPTSLSIPPTIYSQMEQAIDNNTNVTQKLVAKIFAYIAYIFTIILPIVDAFIKIAHCAASPSLDEKPSVDAFIKIADCAASPSLD